MGVCKIAHPMLEATDVFFVFIVDKWKSIMGMVQGFKEWQQSGHELRFLLP